MMRRIIWMTVTVIVAVVLLYLSRFWVFEFWSRDGLLGVKELRPQGGLLARWLRGTEAAPFELLIWVLGGFLILTGLQKIHDRMADKDG